MCACVLPPAVRSFFLRVPPPHHHTQKPQHIATPPHARHTRPRRCRCRCRSYNQFDSLPPPRWINAADLRQSAIAADDPGFWASQSSGRALIGEVTLGNNRLKGTIPPALMALPILSLDLGSNKLTGSVPVVAGLNPFIRELFLDSNKVGFFSCVCVLCVRICCARRPVVLPAHTRNISKHTPQLPP